jgi:hypothetical protein
MPTGGESLPYIAGRMAGRKGNESMAARRAKRNRAAKHDVTRVVQAAMSFLISSLKE